MEGLVASAKARTLKSGLIQIVAEILNRLTREGVLDREDAWEYLANSREAWRSPDEEAVVADRLTPAVEYSAEDDAEEGSSGDEEDSIDERPLSHLVERLDSTVFGLIEALMLIELTYRSSWTKHLRDRSGLVRSPVKKRMSPLCTERCSAHAPTSSGGRP